MNEERNKYDEDDSLFSCSFCLFVCNRQTCTRSRIQTKISSLIFLIRLANEPVFIDSQDAPCSLISNEKYHNRHKHNLISFYSLWLNWYDDCDQSLHLIYRGAQYFFNDTNSINKLSRWGAFFFCFWKWQDNKMVQHYVFDLTRYRITSISYENEIEIPFQLRLKLVDCSH